MEIYDWTGQTMGACEMRCGASTATGVEEVSEHDTSKRDCQISGLTVKSRASVIAWRLALLWRF